MIIRHGQLRLFTPNLRTFGDGDYYMRYILLFDLYILGFLIKPKIVIYDVTMFENSKEHEDNWQKMIDEKSKIKTSIIKDRKIF